MSTRSPRGKLNLSYWRTMFLPHCLEITTQQAHRSSARPGASSALTLTQCSQLLHTVHAACQTDSVAVEARRSEWLRRITSSGLPLIKATAGPGSKQPKTRAAWPGGEPNGPRSRTTLALRGGWTEPPIKRTEKPGVACLCVMRAILGDTATLNRWPGDWSDGILG